MEFERLIAFFDGDLSGLKKSAQEANRIIDNIEKKFNNLKLEIKSTASGDIEAKFKNQEKLAQQSALLQQKLEAQTANVKEKLAQQSAQFQQKLEAQTASAREKISQQSFQFQQKLELERQKTATATETARMRLSQQAEQFETKRADALARAHERAANSTSSFSSRLTVASAAGNLFANAISNVSSEVTQFVVDGIKMNASLDKLVRFTATLDKNFQNPIALRAFTDDIKNLSTEIPFTAERIAEASFSIKSAFSNLDRPQTVEFLRQFGLAATASNADIAEFTKNTIALAKVFKVEMKDLPAFMAKVNATFKDGLAADSEVAQGFNRTTTSITNLKLTLADYLAVMSTVQSTTANAAEATTNIKSLFDKLADGKYIEGLKEVFNIDRFNADGSLKGVNQVINEIANSLKGLPDNQRIAKIFEVFKDREARDGLTALITNIDTYNAKLKDANGAEAYKATQNLMLDSIESRWTRFWNNIKNDQSGLGGSLSELFLSMFDSTTILGGITIFFNQIGGAIIQGVVQTVQIFDSVASTISNSILGMFFDEAEVEKYRLKSTEWLNSLSKSITDTTKTNTQYILQQQKEYWQKFADSTADPEAKARALKNVESLTKSIQSSINNQKADLYESYKTLMKSALEGIKSSDEEANKRGEQAAQSLVDSINKVLSDPNLDPAMAEEFRKLLEEIKKTAEQYGVTLQNVAFRLGSNVGLGLIRGIDSQRGSVVEAAVRLANSAIVPTQQTLQEASPSKVFIKIGSFVGEGFVIGIKSQYANVVSSSQTLANSVIRNVTSLPKSLFNIGKETAQAYLDGINAVKASPQASNSSLFDIGTTKTTKNDKSGVEMLNQLLGEIARFNVEGKLANTMIELTASKFAKLTPEIKSTIIAAAEYIDKLTKQKEIQDKLNQANDKALSDFSNLADEYLAMPVSKLDEINKLLSNEAVTKAINERAKSIGVSADYLTRYLRLTASLKDDEKAPYSTDGLGGKDRTDQGIIISQNKSMEAEIEPPSFNRNNEVSFLDLVKNKISDLRSSLPSLSDTLKGTFSSALDGIGSVFSRSIDQWDGTLSGFFKSVGTGFADLMKQITAELIKMAVIKGVVSLATSIFGGAIGGVSGGGNILSAGGVTTTTGTIALPTTFRIPGYASGGNPRVGELSIVGEEGPELFIPGRSGTIINNTDTKNLLNRSNNTVINNYNSVKQTIHAPRGIVAPKSARQAADQAMGGLQKGSR